MPSQNSIAAREYLAERLSRIDEDLLKIDEQKVSLAGRKTEVEYLLSELDSPVVVRRINGSGVDDVPASLPQSVVHESRPVMRAGTIKAEVLDILRSGGTAGVPLLETQEMLADRGFRFARNTVTATLSVLKQAGAIEKRGKRFRIARGFQAPPSAKGVKRAVADYRISLGAGGPQFKAIMKALSKVGNAGLTAVECRDILCASGMDTKLSSIGGRFTMMASAGYLDHVGNKWILRPEHRVVAE